MAESFGIDVIVNEEILLNAPECVHGPTLLFERLTKTGRRRFYACSACRDRKSCSFFEWAEDRKIQSRKKKSVTVRKSTDQNRLTKLNEVLAESGQCSYCRTCSELLLDEDEISRHAQHDVKKVTKEELQKPTYLIQPSENNKKEAQFYFNQRTNEFLVSTLKRMAFSSVICIGCPRIYERVCQDRDTNAILLDIDERLRQFYSPKQLVLYNMFNHHFFDGSAGKETYENFLLTASVGKLAIFIDPPFGGLVEPVAFTLSRITNEWRSLGNSVNCDAHPAVFWMFPYFIEKKILEHCPRFKMLDYIVYYDNHKVFQSKDQRKVSPIRIFTNLSEENVVLPESEGYRYCAECKKYVSEMNRHCPICQLCTSKNGRPYTHCEMCQKCVKGTHVHCLTCGCCCPHNHVCGQKNKFAVGCFDCGDLGHKKYQCRFKNKKKRLGKPSPSQNVKRK